MPYQRSLADLQRAWQNAYGNARPTDAMTDQGMSQFSFENWLNPQLEAGGGTWKDLGNGMYELPDFDQSDWVESLWPALAIGGVGAASGGFGLGDLISGGGATGGGGMTLGDSSLGSLVETGAGGADVGGLTSSLQTFLQPTDVAGVTAEAGAEAGDWSGWSSPTQYGAETGLTDLTGDIARLTAEAGFPSFSSGSNLPFGLTGGDILRGGATILGSGINYLGATNAANAQEKAASDQQGLLRYMYDQNRADLAPWREAGVGALGNLTNLTTPGKQLDTAMLDPGYAFRQAEGEKGINRAAAARGLWDSGRTYKALDRFNQDYATGEFSNVFNRNAALAGIGQTAVGQGVNAAQNYGQQAGESMLGAGNARASSYVGGANALSGGLSSLFNYYAQSDMLDRILRGRG